MKPYSTAVSQKIEPPEWQGAGCGPRAGTETCPYPAQGWCLPLYLLTPTPRSVVLLLLVDDPYLGGQLETDDALGSLGCTKP